MALVRGNTEKVHLRVLGRDLWRRFGGGFRRGRYRGAETATPAEPLRLVETRLRYLGNAAGRGRHGAAALGRAQILQRIRTERTPQRRHDEPRGEELFSHYGRRDDPAVQVLPQGIRRRRAV